MPFIFAALSTPPVCPVGPTLMSLVRILSASKISTFSVSKVAFPKVSKVLAKEIGIARYERIKDFDWSAGTNYWKSSHIFWKEVRDAWNRKLNSTKKFNIL